MHKLHLTDLNLLETHKKLEIMEQGQYVAKVTCTKSEVQAISALQDNPKAKTLTTEFSQLMQDSAALLS